MKRYSLAVALAVFAILSGSAVAVTFPSLTTIYIGSGARDSAQGPNLGLATVIHCSNVSVLTASVRILLLHSNGSMAGVHTFNSVVHGSTVSLATHPVAAYYSTDLNVLEINSGVVNIEVRHSRECSATPPSSMRRGRLRPLSHFRWCG